MTERSEAAPPAGRVATERSEAAPPAGRAATERSEAAYRDHDPSAGVGLDTPPLAELAPALDHRAAPARGGLHHVELRTHDLDAARAPWAWLLDRLGYAEFQSWPDGVSWLLGDTYLVLERAPLPAEHDRRGAGLSHLAFHAGSRAEVDALWAEAPANGWAPLYTDRHPWAGGPEHYAAFLESSQDRVKVELVALPATG